MKKNWSGAGLMAHMLTAFKAKARRKIRLQKRSRSLPSSFVNGVKY